MITLVNVVKSIVSIFSEYIFQEPKADNFQVQSYDSSQKWLFLRGLINFAQKSYFCYRNLKSA